jgi:hypothetical protein
MNYLHYELTQAHVGDLNRKAEGARRAAVARLHRRGALRLQELRPRFDRFRSARRHAKPAAQPASNL